MDLKELDRVNPDEHWYYQAKLVAIRGALRKYAPAARSLIDVGAGSGFFSTRAATAYPDIKVTCVDPNYSVDTPAIDGKPNFIREAPHSGADAYLFIDVLEHVDDDVNLLRSYVDRAPSGAVVVISVPAFMSMWSGHDVYLEHFRRYRLSEMVEVARAAGLDVVHRRYLFGLVFPPAWLFRHSRRAKAPDSNMGSLPRVVNAVLRSVESLEHRFPWNPLFGVSAFVVARVPD